MDKDNIKYIIYKVLMIMWVFWFFSALIIAKFSDFFVDLVADYFDYHNTSAVSFLLFLNIIASWIAPIFIFNKFNDLWVNKKNHDILSTKYSYLSTNNLKFTSDNDSSISGNTYNYKHVKFPTNIKIQEEIENNIKVNDPAFSKVYFKQKAIARFNYIQASLKNKDIKKLKVIENDELFDYQTKYINNLEGLSNYNIICSFIDNYEIKNKIEFLNYYVNIKNENNDELTYVMTFSRKKGTSTKIELKHNINSCPKCGGELSDNLVACNYCGSIIPDEFGWIVTNLELYNKEMD